MERRDILFDLILGDRVVVSNGQNPDVMAKVGRDVMLEGGSVAAGLYEWEIVVFTFREVSPMHVPRGGRDILKMNGAD